jgi:hypothetical protein
VTFSGVARRDSVGVPELGEDSEEVLGELAARTRRTPD